MNKILILVTILFNINLTAQLKVGSNKSTISSNTYFEIESTSGSKVVVRKDTAMMGINNTNPKNKLEITHGTSGNSGLRFTDLTSLNSALSASSVGQKFLSVNSTGDVVLANSVDQVIAVTGLASNLVSPVSAATFQAGTFENNYSKIDSNVLYLNQSNGTTWVYTAANGGQYKSYVAPASTEWYLAGGTTDAGSNKTSSIYRTGNVGIGNASPTNNLDVVGGISIRNVAGVAGSNYGMEINTSSNSPRIDWVANGAYIGQFASNTTDFLLKNSLNNLGNFRFSTSVSGSGIERMTILNNGNIGIGNAAPTYKLDVSGKGRFTDTLFGTKAQFNNLAVGATIDSIVTIDASGNLKRRNANSYSNNWFSRTTNTSATRNTDTIYQMGNVGIGNNNPLNRLVVKGLNNQPSSLGTAQTNAIFRLEGETNHALDMGTFANSPWGSYIQSHNKAAATFIPLSMNPLGGNVGVGTNTPQTLLDVSASTGGSSVTIGTIGTSSTDQVTVNFGTKYDRINGVGAPTNLGWQFGARGNAWTSPQANILHASYWNGTGWYQAITIQPTGNFGIGTTNPISKLEVSGSATNTTAYNAAAATTIDFSQSNLAYTSASAGAFTLTNIKDGGTYTLAVRGTTSGTASFSSTGFSFKSVNNATTIAGKETLYTFLVMGTTVYVYMTTGF